MTPDELRRMDNDLCIIFEKGLKPVKARKYYYFEKPIARKLQEHTLNHLEFDVGVRGKWRKYNPYNPYVEENENTKKNDLKVESLDDLFDDDIDDKKETNNDILNNGEIQNKEDFITPLEEDKEQIKSKKTSIEAPMLPQEDDEQEVFSVDVQKELEAKFDELFGPIDED